MLLEILNTISIYSIFIPILAGGLNYSNLETNTRVLLLLLVFASVPHIATALNKPTSLPYVFYNSYILAEAILWPLIFIYSTQSLHIKRFYFILWTVNFFTPTIYLAYNGIFGKFHTPLVCTNSFLQIIYIIIFFYEINQRNAFIALKKEPMLWLCTGLLFYSTCTFFLFLFYKKINSYMTKSELNILWQVHNIFNTLMYLFFSVGLSIKNKRRDV